jgi:DNA-binding response OmpR family regulator
VVTGDSRADIAEASRTLTGSDIVTKPFEDVALLATVERALRWNGRTLPSEETELPDELVIVPFERCCHWKGKKIQLTPTELSIVNELWTAKGRIVKQDRLVAKLKSGGGHAATQHITNIRKKFEAVDSTFEKIGAQGGGYIWSQ